MSEHPARFGFEALDACHQQIQVHLGELAALAQRIGEGGVDARARLQAGAIDTFFSGTSHRHHLDEEKNVFPPLLASGDAELVATVHALHQDHGWIEQNWAELSPQLRALAAGNDWVDTDEFLHYVEVFLDLCRGHIALEESIIYPQAKARLAQAVASRLKKLPPRPAWP